MARRSKSPDVQPVDIEATSDVVLGIGDIATVHVRGGRREAQEKARSLEARWSQEVEPHLAGARVTDLAALDAKSAEARDLDSEIRATDTELESLRTQIAGLNGAVEALREASDWAAACRAALGNTTLETLAVYLKSLGSDAFAELRKRRQEFSKEVEAARAIASQAGNDQTLADERVRQSRLTLDAAIAARDGTLAAFPKGIDSALANARDALQSALAEKEEVAAGFASLENEIDARKKRIDAALSSARMSAEQAAAAVESAQAGVTTAKTNHAAEHGRLIELRKQRDAENIPAT